MGNAVPKQTHRTPKDQRGDNPYKSQFAKPKPKSKGLAQGKPKLKPERPANCFKTYAEKKPPKGLKPGKGFGVQRGTRIKPRRLLEASRPLGGQPGQSTLKRFSLDRNAMRKLDRVKILKPIGPRGRRLAPEDKKQAAAVKGLACLCGCNTHEREPKAIQWMHLQRRNILSTRHKVWATAPGCEHLHPWLDQGKGVQARKELFELAEELDRRLTPEDAYPILSQWGYYTDLLARTSV